MEERLRRKQQGSAEYARGLTLQPLRQQLIVRQFRFTYISWKTKCARNIKTSYLQRHFFDFTSEAQISFVGKHPKTRTVRRSGIKCGPFARASQLRNVTKCVPCSRKAADHQAERVTLRHRNVIIENGLYSPWDAQLLQF